MRSWSHFTSIALLSVTDYGRFLNLSHGQEINSPEETRANKNGFGKWNYVLLQT